MNQQEKRHIVKEKFSTETYRLLKLTLFRYEMVVIYSMQHGQKSYMFEMFSNHMC